MVSNITGMTDMMCFSMPMPGKLRLGPCGRAMAVRRRSRSRAQLDGRELDGVYDGAGVGARGAAEEVTARGAADASGRGPRC